MDSRLLLKRAKAARESQSASAARKDVSRIDSPFASYDSTGKLKCVLCNIYIKTEALFQTHVATRQHKDRLTILMQAKEQVKSQFPSEVSHKRKLEGQDPSENKRVTKETGPLVLSKSYDSEEDEPESEPPPPPIPQSEANREQEEIKGERSASILSALPVGFFDTVPQELEAQKVQLDKDDFEREFSKLKDEIEMDELKLKSQRTVVFAEPSVGKIQEADAIEIDQSITELPHLEENIENRPDVEEILLEEERRRKLDAFHEKKAQIHQKQLAMQVNKKTLADVMRDADVSSDEEGTIGDWRIKTLSDY